LTSPLTDRFGLDEALSGSGSALAFAFAGDCLLKNDLIPSDRSDTGWMNVGDSFPTLPTSGGTG